MAMQKACRRAMRRGMQGYAEGRAGACSAFPKKRGGMQIEEGGMQKACTARPGMQGHAGACRAVQGHATYSMPWACAFRSEG